MTPRSVRHAFTLLEVVIVLAILGLLSSMVVFATVPLARRDDSSERAASIVAAARQKAIREGSAVTGSILQPWRDSVGGEHRASLTFTAYPDGSVMSDSGLALDHLRGRPRPGPGATP